MIEKVIITGGGTGGHVYPAVGFGKIILHNYPNAEIYYIGNKNSFEEKAAAENGFKFIPVETKGFQARNNLFKNIRTSLLGFTSLIYSFKKIRKIKPDLIIGTGGYVSGPAVLSGQLQGIPSIIHEQNSTVGITNRMLSFLSSSIITSIPNETFEKNKKNNLLGNPSIYKNYISKNENNINDLPINFEKNTILFLGGSQGAKKINDFILKNYKNFSEKKENIILISGERYFEQIKKENKSFDYDEKHNFLNYKNIFIFPFFEYLEQLMKKSSLIFSRAGGSTISEILSLNKKTVFIPSPNVSKDHQRKNAKSIVDLEAALMIDENNLNFKNYELLSKKMLEDKQFINNLLANLNKIGSKDLEKDISNVIKSLTDEK